MNKFLPIALALMMAGCGAAAANTNLNAVIFAGDKVVAAYYGDDAAVPFVPYTNRSEFSGGDFHTNQFSRLTNGAVFYFPDDLNDYTKQHFVNSKCWKKTSYRSAYSCDGRSQRYMDGSENVWTYDKGAYK